MISLQLEISQVDTILGILSQAPYNVSAPLIEEIRKQALPQVPAPAETNN